jgi:RNA polymerase sigma-70 factor (ECF subfamily)
MGRWAPAEIVRAALAGDEPAAERLVAAVWPACFRLAATVTGDRSLAQDAAQEACVIVHRKIHGLRNPDAFDAWLYRIVLNESARVRRRHAPVIEPLERDTGDDAATTMDVWRALAALPLELREVTVLFYFDDLKGDEIAAILRIPHATVRTRLARARERLRGLLDDYDDASSPAHLEAKLHAF